MTIAIVLAAAMMTAFGEKVTPENAWREYPRPQMVRANWTCLNGRWDYAVTSVTNTLGNPWDPNIPDVALARGTITVPFAIESQLSGVGRLLQADEFLWYRRTLEVKKTPGMRQLLHFDGVDFRTMVFIGHREVTEVPHEGAHDPFTLDVTDYVTNGSNALAVCVWDPTGDYKSRNCPWFYNSRGKQINEPFGCFYTRCSGIWQSVWMEAVPECHIKDYEVLTDIDRGEVTIKVKVDGEGEQKMETSVFDAEGKKIGKLIGPPSRSTFTFSLPDVHLWSPEYPYLYTFTTTYGQDEIKGYFAMRKIEKRKDSKGVLRFFLNNEPYFLIGTLDQGWWPDGLLTPPSDEAMAHDIRTLKDCGFNMMRKHIKVEPRRYYHLCDTLGLIVLQDLPCGEGDQNGPMGLKSVMGYGFQRMELKRMLDNLQKVPSILMWIPYNEGWSQPGEFLTHSTLDFVSAYDPTRLVNGPSGAWDFEGGQILPNGWGWKNRITTSHKSAGECEAADVVDLHLYRSDYPDGIHGHCTMLPVNDRRVSFLGEFGGLGHPVPGHLWQNASGSWGYGGIEDTKSPEGLEKAYLTLMDDIAALAAEGLGGCVYTQTTDVEVEVNGIMTYDRRVLKFDPTVLKKAHDTIIRRANKGF